MKKLILASVFALCGVCSAYAAPLKSQVKETFELTSIVFRLSGAPEYVNHNIPSYTQEIDKHFAPYTGHELIDYAKSLRREHGVAYDAPMKAAACLEIRDGSVVVSPSVDVSKIGDVDYRWTPDSFLEYVALLDDFYKESEFHAFYISHNRLYKAATKRLDKVLGLVNVEWFESFFGEELGEPIIIASMSNGPSNYGFGTMDGQLKQGIVIGTRVDGKGMPQYSPFSTYPLIVHELTHGFSNPLLERTWDESVSPAVLKIYPHVEETMQQLGYGDPGIMMTEWFTRLCEFMYFRENPTKHVRFKSRVGISQQLGFIWMERSVALMDEFYAHRDKYPHVDDFMPRIFEFINDTGSNFEQVIAEARQKNPRVIEIHPAFGAVLDSDRVVIKFSEPMFAGAHGIKHLEKEGVLMIPMKRDGSWQDSTTFVLPIDTKKLQKGKKYGVQLNRLFFQSEWNYPLAEDFDCYFLTAE